jgi:glyoxylase-like metal-dependent hydrolase (beta-lactamase superfamily II)
MNLLPGLDLVGSGWLGFSISDHDDCNIFLVHDGGDAVLIDAGCGRGAEAVVRHIAAAGVEPESVSRILLTHAHPDHSAGAFALAQVLGAQVHAAPIVADILRRGDEDAAGLTAARGYGLYPPDVRLHPLPVQDLAGGDTLRVGSIAITTVDTPGHSDGHLCFLAEVAGRAVLFSGDLVFTRGRVAILGTPDAHLGRLADSLRRVASLRPDVLLPGHGTLALEQGHTHLDAAVAALDREQLPPALLP